MKPRNGSALALEKPLSIERNDMEYWKYSIESCRVLECAAAALRGKKSKIGEVLCEVQTVECLACNEGAEDLCAQD